MQTVAVRELRQNLSRYLRRVKAGESLVVTERGQEVARLIPMSGAGYEELARRVGASVPINDVADVAARLGGEPSPAGTTDAALAEARRDRA